MGAGNDNPSTPGSARSAGVYCPGPVVGRGDGGDTGGGQGKGQTGVAQLFWEYEDELGRRA